MMHEVLGGKWRVRALIELGLSDFVRCQNGADWCKCFVKFMLNIEYRAAQAVAECV